jgi:hypothetical protein
MQKTFQLPFSDSELILFWRRQPIAGENMKMDEFYRAFYGIMEGGSPQKDRFGRGKNGGYGQGRGNNIPRLDPYYNANDMRGGQDNYDTNFLDNNNNRGGDRAN